MTRYRDTDAMYTFWSGWLNQTGPPHLLPNGAHLFVGEQALYRDTQIWMGWIGGQWCMWGRPEHRPEIEADMGCIQLPDDPLEGWEPFESVAALAHEHDTCSFFRVFSCGPEEFRPIFAAPFKRLPAGHPMLMKSDEAMFAVEKAGGIVSWARCYWRVGQTLNISVKTESEYRGKGYAKTLVSAVTEYVLEQNVVPIYKSERENLPSIRVALALGYRERTRELVWRGSR